MNHKQLESELSTAHMYNQSKKIEEIYVQLINTKSKLDRWFNKYIDMFDDTMNSVANTHPVWKLYNAKFDEYSELNKNIRTAEYYMKRVTHV
jgi:hypothetical protein